MKRSLGFALAALSVLAFAGCKAASTEDDGPKPGTVTTKDGKPLTAEQVRSLPKAEGAFDGTPGGPGAMKKKGAPH